MNSIVSIEKNDLAFVFEGTSVRILDGEQEPWFALIDLCNALELRNPTMIAKRLDADEVTKFNLGSLEGETWFVNEAGLYHVILTSRSEKAKPFRRFVTHEVLPCIRKNGYYSTMSDEELYQILGERLKERQELILRTYTIVEPSTIKTSIPLATVSEKRLCRGEKH